MILTILWIVALLVDIILIVITAIRYFHDCCDDILPMVDLFLSLAVICSAIPLISFLIKTNNPINKKNMRIKLDNQIASLNATYSVISKREDNSIVEISTYNSLVKEYKEEIDKAHYCRNNLWINWFTCSIYDDYTGNEVQYFRGE